MNQMRAEGLRAALVREAKIVLVIQLLFQHLSQELIEGDKHVLQTKA
jgi:hypothetical protein